MTSLRGNCKEEKGRGDAGSRDRKLLSPDLPPARLSTIHIRSTVSKFIGKMASQCCCLGRGCVLLLGHFRENAGANTGDITCIRNSWSLRFVWAQREAKQTGFPRAETEVEKEGQPLWCWRQGCVSGDTVCSNSLGIIVPAPLLMGQECVFPTERRAGQMSFFILLDQFMTERKPESWEGKNQFLCGKN